MKSIEDFKQLTARFKRGPSDVVGVDVAEDSLNLIRMRKSASGAITVVAADSLPAITLPAADAPSKAVAIPQKLKGKYACVAAGGGGAVIKLLSFPGHFDPAAEAKVIENMGLESPDDYRISYKLISEGHGRAEARVLAVAMPEAEAAGCVRLFPSGVPAPFSLEISGLAVLSAFLNANGETCKEEAIGVVDFGPAISTFALFNKNYLALIRRFPVGTNTVLAKVQETLGVDQETANGIVSDGSFDISQSVGDVMEPLVKQLIVSRDFVERRENCQLARMYVSGALTVSRDVVDEVRTSIGVDTGTWNPLQGLTVEADAIPASLAGKEWRFGAAAGACLATFEET